MAKRLRRGRGLSPVSRWRFAKSLSLLSTLAVSLPLRSRGAGPYVYAWGAVSADIDPRNGEAGITLTWRGVPELYDSALPPAPVV